MGIRNCDKTQHYPGMRCCMLCATMWTLCCLAILHFRYSPYLYDVYSFKPSALPPQPGDPQRHQWSKFLTELLDTQRDDARESVQAQYDVTNRPLHAQHDVTSRPFNAQTDVNIQQSHVQTTVSPQDCENLTFQTDKKELQPFRPAMSGKERCRLLATLDAFHTAMHRAGVPYFIYSGTLLGSWRHHGMVPWDDDVDVVVPKSQWGAVPIALKALKPGFVLDTSQGVRWKLYMAGSAPIPGCPWQFPFLDISFYYENKLILWDYDTRASKYTFPRHWIFPLRLRPFHGRLLPAPRQTEKVLRLTYTLHLCTNGYNHRLEMSPESNIQVPCQRLDSLLPFVQRDAVAGGCVETLVNRGRVLGNFTGTEACSVQSGPAHDHDVKGRGEETKKAVDN